MTLFSLVFFEIMGQLPVNVNKQFGWQITGSTLAPPTEDWIYGIKSLSGGGFIATGYTMGANKYPIIIKLNAAGSVIWEQKYDCIGGQGYDIYDTPNGYIIIGEGQRSNGCGDPPSMFSLLADKTTGTLVQSYGIKLYNEQTLPFPLSQNGQVHTNVGGYCGGGAPRSCEIMQGGQLTGFMICGNYQDNGIPIAASGLNLTSGSFLLQIDVNGRPVTSFGNAGLKLYYQNVVGRCYDPHFHSVCVNYNGSGVPQGFVVVGSINEQISVTPPYGIYNNDALVSMTDMAGNITFSNVFDDNTRLKNTALPVGYPYTDVVDNPICANPGTFPYTTLLQENSNEMAVEVKQVTNGGDFIIVADFDYAFFFYPTICSLTYPTTGYFLLADPAVIRMDPAGAFIWATNVTQSTGRDFENSLLVNNNSIFVLGSVKTEPFPGIPTKQHAVVSKLNFSGTIIYEQAYEESTGGQTMICPFTFDFYTNGTTQGIIMAGDNDLNSNDYNFIGYSPN